MTFWKNINIQFRSFSVRNLFIKLDHQFYGIILIEAEQAKIDNCFLLEVWKLCFAKLYKKAKASIKKEE